MSLGTIWQLTAGIQLRTLGNTAFLAFADLFGKAVLFLVFILFARAFGNTQFGYLSFAYGLGSILVVISDLGINQFIIREVAAGAQPVVRSLDKLFLFKAALFIPYVLAALLAGMLFDIAVTPLLYVMAIALYFGIDSLHQYVRNILRAREEMRRDLVSRVTERLLLLVAFWPLVRLDRPLLAVACFPAAALLTLLFDLFRLKPFRLAASPPAARLDWRGTLAGALPFTIAHILFTVYFRIDTLMLQALAGFDAVGTYNAAYRLFEGVQMIPIAFAGSLFPAFSRIGRESRHRLAAAAAGYMKLVLALSAAAAAVMIALSTEIISWVYGPGYAESARALTVLGVGVVFNFYYMVFTSLLAAMGRQAIVAWIGGAVLLLNVGLNYALIPRCRGVGAAWATVVCDALIAVSVFVTTTTLLRRERNAAE